MSSYVSIADLVGPRMEHQILWDMQQTRKRPYVGCRAVTLICISGRKLQGAPAQTESPIAM
jgi:hypothetical protein